MDRAGFLAWELPQRTDIYLVLDGGSDPPIDRHGRPFQHLMDSSFYSPYTVGGIKHIVSLRDTLSELLRVRHAIIVNEQSQLYVAVTRLKLERFSLQPRQTD